MTVFQGSVRVAIVFVISMLIAQSALGQCSDWYRGFGSTATGLNGPASAFQVFDDGSGPALYVGGFFTTAGGQSAQGIAKWDGSAWSPLGGGLGGVTSLAIYDDGGGPALYAGGQFRMIGGAPADYVAKWDGAAWQPLGAGPDRNVSSLAVYDDGTGPALYVAGVLDSVDGHATEKIASWNGSVWRTWSGGPLARDRFAMAYDPIHQRTVLFGGKTSDGIVRGDTWTWDGAQWTLAATSGPGPRIDAVMTYDPVNQRVLLVGGSPTTGGFAEMSTWAWDGAQWTQIAAPSTLSRRINFGLAYDTGRNRLVLFGGRIDVFASSFLDETWEFNGSTWTSVTVANRPRRRIMHGMVYDPVRAKTVVFGGNSSAGIVQDTWEFNGTVWTQVSSAGPSPRVGHGMVYDTLRNRTVVFGGSQQDTSSATDTWAWNGTSWTLLDGGDPAWPRRYGTMVYDAARDRLMQRTELGTTWLFDQVSWSPVHAGGFNGEIMALAVYDAGSGPALFACGSFTQVAGVPGRIARWNGAGTWEAVNEAPFLILGDLRAMAAADLGSGPRLYLGGNIGWPGPHEIEEVGLVQWNGATWTRLSPDSGAVVMGMNVYDDGTGPALYVAGSVTWGNEDYNVTGFGRWDGTNWSAAGFRSPSARRDAATAYDAARGETILYGGATQLTTPPGALADTWVWDGRNWTSIAAPAPGPRFGHAMAFDQNNSRVLLVGGGPTSTTSDAKTWSWDGAAWSLLNASFGGGSRTLHAMAYDSARGRLVLFGGRDNSGVVVPGTWEFDGATWSLVTMSGPSARHSHAMAYDPVRQRTVLYAGVDGSGVHYNDVWEWDGSVWVNAMPDAGTGLRRPAMTYDPFRQRIVADGGIDATATVFSGLREWNGVSWSGFLPNPPGVRYSHLLAFDDRLNALMLFGGILPVNPSDGEFRLAGDTWQRMSGLPNDEWKPVIEGVVNPKAVAGFDDGSGPAIFVGGDFTTAGPSTPSSRIAKWGVDCAPPVITDQPDSRTSTYDQNVFFSTTAIGTGYLGYRWHHNGVPISDVPNHFTGARTASLRIHPGWAFADTGSYDVVVHSAAGDVVSEVAVLNIVCPADLNSDGLVDFSDYLDFLNFYDIQDPRVDFNLDGLVDFSDYLEFLNLYEMGC